MRRLFAALALSAAGCYSPVTELVTPHVEAGGTVTATIDGGASLVKTAALADGTAQPMNIEGTSASLVFGLIFGSDDLSGMPATAQLLAGQPVQMTVSAGGATQLSVHLDGTSCAALSGVVHLTPDGMGHVSGDYSGAGDGCQMSGTLDAVPIQTQE